MYEYGVTFPVGYDSTRLKTYENEALARAKDYALSSRNILTLLGDFWTDYYADTEVLKAVHAGAATILGEDLKTTFRQVISSSLIDFPFDTAGNLNMFVFDAAKATYVLDPQGKTSYITYSIPELKNISVLTDRLFEPSVILEKDAYFKVIETDTGIEVRFYVDIFQDENILKTVSSINLDRRIVILWGSDVIFKERLIYERYGRYLYKTSYDTRDYHYVILALQKFYVSTKSIKNIEIMINILMGSPYARYDNETVVSVGSDKYNGRTYHKITTDRAVYWAPLISIVTVEPASIVNRLDLLARITTVADWKTDPTWYDKVNFPGNMLISGTNPLLGSPGDDGTYKDTALRSDSEGNSLEVELYELMDQVLKYNLLYIKTNYSMEFSDLTFLSIGDVYQILSSGLPTYLYPLIHGSLGVKMEDEHEVMASTDDDIKVGAGVISSDSYSPTGIIKYNKEYFYDGTPLFNYGNFSDDLRVISTINVDQGAWAPVFDPNFWISEVGTWDGDGHWHSVFIDGFYRMKLIPINGWNIGFRPAAIRIFTADGKAVNISYSIKDTNDNLVGYGWGVESGTELPLSFIDYDIAYIELVTSWMLEVDFIEFNCCAADKVFIDDRNTSFEAVESAFEELPYEVPVEYPLPITDRSIFAIASHDYVDADLADFPIGIEIVNEAFFNGLNADSWKFLHATIEGVECFVEVDVWEPENNRATLWVKVPTLSATKETPIKIEITEVENTGVFPAGGGGPSIVIFDDFTGNDGDPVDDTKWDWGMWGSPVHEIQNNKFHFEYNPLGYSEIWYDAITTLSGDFEVYLDYSVIQAQNVTEWPAEMATILLTDAQYYYTLEFKFGPVSSISGEGYAWEPAGSNNYQTTTTDYSRLGKVKLSRTGSEIRGFIWDGAGWSFNGDPAGVVLATWTGDLIPGLFIGNDPETQLIVDIDNYTISTTASNTINDIVYDDFTGVNGDPPDPNKWDYAITSGSPVLNISTNTLKFASGPAANIDKIDIYSKIFLIGNFDIQIDYNVLSWDAPSSGVSYAIGANFLDEKGVKLIMTFGVCYETTKTAYCYENYDSPVWTSVTTDFSTTGKIRLTRTSGEIRGYIWDGTGWSYDGDPAGVVLASSYTGPLMPGFHLEADYNGAMIATYDNFTINSCQGMTGFVGKTGDTPAKYVWSNGFMGVYHFSQDPAGGVLTDSSGYENHATINGAMVSTNRAYGDGFGYAYQLDGANDCFTSPAVPGGTSTINGHFFWTTTAVKQTMFANGFYYASNYGLALVYLTGGYGFSIYSGNQYTSSSLGPSNMNEWHCSTLASSGTTYTAYRENDLILTRTDSISGYYGSSFIGNESSGVQSNFVGKIDEIRFLNQTKGLTWVKATSAVYDKSILRQYIDAPERTPINMSFVQEVSDTHYVLLPQNLIEVDEPFDADTGQFSLFNNGLPGVHTMTGGYYQISQGSGGMADVVRHDGAALTMPQAWVEVAVNITSASKTSYENFGVGIVRDWNTHICVIANYQTQVLEIHVKVDGTQVVVGSISTTFGSSFKIGFSLVNYRVSKWIDTGGGWEYKGEINISSYIDTQTVAGLSGFYPGIKMASSDSGTTTAQFDNLRFGRFGGTGIRDITLVTNEDGTPYHPTPDTAMFTASISCPGGASSTGIFEMSLIDYYYDQVAALAVSDGTYLKNLLPAHIVKNQDGTYRVSVSTFGGTTQYGLQIQHKHETVIDVLNGSNVIDGMTTLALPETGSDPGVYDAFLVYDDANTRWLMAYTNTEYESFSPEIFYPVLAESNDLITWTKIGDGSARADYEGTKIIKTDGQYFVLAGGPTDAGDSIDVYDVNMNYIGQVDVSLEGGVDTQPHPMIFPYEDRQLLITFDNTKATGGSTFSWGKFQVYESKRYY